MKSTGEIGDNFYDTEKIQYFSRQTFLDFDFLILDINSVLLKLDGNVLHDHEMLEHLIKRKEELEEFANLRNVPVVCFLPYPCDLSFEYDVTHSDYTPSDFLPGPKFSVTAASGKRISIKPKTVLTDFLTKYSNEFCYTSYFDEFNGTIAAEIPHKRHVVAGYTKEVLFLPQLNNRMDGFEGANFLNDLRELLSSFNKSKSDVQLPDWSKKYLVPGESEVVRNIHELERRALEIENTKRELSNTLEEIQSKKLLFTSTGGTLEIQVEQTFKRLGFEILSSVDNRDDIIARYGEKVVVVEIKGVSASATQKHTRQLENWVSDYLLNNEVTAKGILVINTYRDLELNQRTEDDFPNQMIEYSVKREHCLLTTLQLLGLELMISKHPAKKDKLIQSLFDTNGVYQSFSNWKDFIHIDQE